MINFNIWKARFMTPEKSINLQEPFEFENCNELGAMNWLGSFSFRYNDSYFKRFQPNQSQRVMVRHFRATKP